jgi:hypothetical protein
MRALINVTLLTITAFLLIIGCKDDKVSVTSGITGSLAHNSDCKSLNSGDLKSDIADTLSCVHYSYDALNHVVLLIHYNAGFNCCPETLSCEISTSNDTILIREIEKEQACNCECLFDLDIELQGVDEDEYIVKFIEPYAEGQEPLIFEMDLTANLEGDYCVVRTGYPWGF